ncbi:MAG: hypothetical protein Q9180_007002, partial [Flavoplaca navasiana]
PYSAPTLYPLHGPMHTLLSRLITRSSIEQLGFVDWEKVKDLVETAFQSQDQVKLRSAFGIAQWVVLGRRFGVPKAGPMGEGDVEVEVDRVDGDVEVDGVDGDGADGDVVDGDRE